MGGTRLIRLPKVPVLAIDIGGGTQDILLFHPDRTIENCVKLVLPTPTVLFANRIRKATLQGHPIVFTGQVMGGGPITGALKDHLKAGYKAYASAKAALTFHDQIAQVESWGVHIFDEETDNPPGIVFKLSDIDLESLRSALSYYDVNLPEKSAVAVQDHGESAGESNRIFRFRYLQSLVEAGGDLRDWIYRDPPAQLTRMRAAKTVAPGAILSDTGTAAVWGALCDETVESWGEAGCTILNIGNNHTLAMLVQGRRVMGIFEHHTRCLTRDKLARCILRLQAGTLTMEEVFADNGHGAYIHSDYRPSAAFERVSVTGPNRIMVSGLGYHPAVPFGDTMLAGCFGLLAGIAESEGKIENEC